MVQINWTFQSVSDLKEIAAYIALDSEYYSKLQVLRLKSKVEILKSQISIGSLAQEFKNKDIRQLIQGQYRIIYKIVDDNRVDILTIHHSSRDLKRRKIL